MGSSYSSNLYRGGMKEWADKLNSAIKLIEEVRDAVNETIGDDGQYDNAAADGALSQSLSYAIRFIEEQLPKKDRKG